MSSGFLSSAQARGSATHRALPRATPTIMDGESPAGGERGSAVALFLALVIFAGFLAVVLLALGGAVLARHRAGAAADLAALAAVSGPTGSGGCLLARQVAAANQAQLIECRPLGDGSVLVGVRALPGGGWGVLGPAQAHARAAPGALEPADVPPS